MSSTIAVEELRVGMFIHLDGGWLSHPFPLSSFRVASTEQIQTLRGLGLTRVRWSPDKSELPPTAEEAAAAAAAAAQRLAESNAEERLHQQRRGQLAAQREAAQRCERQHAEAAKAWREATDTVGAQPREAGRSTEALTRAMLSKMLVSQDIGIRLVGGGGDRAATHALNTAIVALLMGRSLGLTEQELVDLGTGALMHDVGKLDVPDRFRHLEDGFSSNELNAYRDHVAKGVTLAQRMGLAAGSMVVLAQHHELADGSGFPLRLAGERISMAARLVAIVNRYDNLCNPQSRVIPLTPHEAVSVLFAQGRNRYDAAVLNLFIRMMGVYPAGSLVQLTDDRFAMVIGINSNRPLKPRVLVHDPHVSRSEALIVDLEQHPDLGIRRSMVAARLPSQALDYLDPRPRVSYYFEELERGPHEAVVA